MGLSRSHHISVHWFTGSVDDSVTGSNLIDDQCATKCI